MAITGPYVSQSQVASAVPFDPTSIAYTSTDVQSALAELRVKNVITPEYVTTSNGGNLILTSVDNTSVILSGTGTNYEVTMPDATTLFLGTYYRIYNTTGQIVVIEDFSDGTLFTLAQNSVGFLTLQAQGSAAGTWLWWQSTISMAAGIINYNVISSTAFTTSSTTDVAITGFTVTPQAGTYAIWYNAQNTCTGSGVDNTATIYKAGVSIADSVRQASSPSGTHIFPLSTQTVSQFDGASTCVVQVHTTGTLTVNQRSLLLMRLGT